MNRLFILSAMALLLAALPAFGGDPRDEDLGSALLSTNNPVQEELEKVMSEDDAALDDVNGWIQENNAFASQGVAESKADLNKRILARLQTVREAYQDFIKRHPTNAPVYLAYGSFLNDIGDEEGACAQYEKSRQLDPKNPAVWNDLANYYGEYSPVTNAFAYYSKAVELNPFESVYYENWATTVYLFRRDAGRFYSINEQQVFDKSLALYRKAMALDPTNFVLQTFYAESYYGIRPWRTNDALLAWTNALTLAHDEVEREGIYVHLARMKTTFGQFAEAQAHLDAITNANYADLKKRLARSLLQHEEAATNNGVVPDTSEVTNAVSVSTNFPAASSIQKTP